MQELIELDRFTVPLGQQEIEIQQIRHAEGAMPMLRLRIREGKRFTIFDLDPVSIQRLESTFHQWLSQQAK